MRRVYEYLQTSGTLEGQRKQNDFLYKIDSSLNQRQYVKMTLLSWEERPLKEVQGIVTSGSLTKDGSSSVRRTMSLTVNLDGGEYDATSLDMDFSLNKKIFVELGVKNDTGEWGQYPILWFPQGVFFINRVSLSSSSSSSVSMSLNLRDKMSLLNGDVGGIIPASTIFDSVDTQSSTGEYISQKVTVYELIENLVNHFGGEDLCNIVIEDVDLKIRRVVRWTAENTLYLYQDKPEYSSDKDKSLYYYHAQIDEKPDESKYSDIKTVAQGEDCGYVYDDFVYTSELSVSGGSKVTDVLDKIVSYLGNYEYFYDEYGIFHFREIKNYVNTTYATQAIEDMTKNSYLMSTTTGKTSYAFSDATNIISLSSNPSYDNIKNDYIVEGLRKSTVSDVSYPVRYHLAIDSKPAKTYGGEDGVFTYTPRKGIVLYTDPDTNQTKLCFPKVYDSKNDDTALPPIGTLDVIYYDKSFSHQETGEKKYQKYQYKGGEKDVGRPLYFVVRPCKYELAEKTSLSDISGYTGYYIPIEFEKVYVGKKDETESWVDENGNQVGDESLAEQVPQKTSESTMTLNVFTEAPGKILDDGRQYYSGMQKDLTNGKSYEHRNDPCLIETPECVKWNSTEYEILPVVATYPEDGDKAYIPQDWRTELYVRGEYAKTNGTDKGYYYEELASGWPQIYDLDKQEFIKSIDSQGTKTTSMSSLTDGNMFLDFIDAGTSALGEYAVNAIGRRTDFVSDNDVNCLFQPEIPDIVFVNSSDDDKEAQELELLKRGEKYSQVQSDIYAALATGGYKNGAFDKIKYELYLHTGYQRTLSITAIPAFYLEPSIRVSVRDKTTNTYGDYVIKSITYSLGTSPSMSVNATELVERF